MPVPSVITDLSATAASNSPAGGDAVFPDLDNYLRGHASLIRYGDTKSANVASATNIDLGAAVGRVVDVTGTTTVASFGTVSAGVWRIVRFTGALTLTHNATSLILPGGANITTEAGDCAIAVSLGSGNWVVTHFQRVAGSVGFAVYSSASLAGSSNARFPTYASTGYNYGTAMDASTGAFTAPRDGWYSFSATFTAVTSGAPVVTEVGLTLGGSFSLFAFDVLYSERSGITLRANVASGPIFMTAGQAVSAGVTNTTSLSSVVVSSFFGAAV